MQSRRNRDQNELFVAGSLYDLVPADHLLRRIDAVVDFSFIHEMVRDRYCQDNGRASIDPESALRLMLSGFLEGIVHDRVLLRRAQTDLALRWFAGYRLDEKLPNHSSLTRIRQRWGAALFEAIFARTVSACMDAGLVEGTTVHVDATLIRADVSWESLTREHVEKVLEVNAEGSDDDEPPAPGAGRPGRKSKRPQKKSTTDPDATMSTSTRNYHLEPTYKQHTAVDDKEGVIVDVALDTGQANEGQQLLKQLERIERNTGRAVQTLTADKSYAHTANYAALEEREIDPVIPPQAANVRRPGTQRIPARRFKYDAYHDRVTCPAGKRLEQKSRTTKDDGYTYKAATSDCRNCPMRERCISPTQRARTIVIIDGHTALLRARRRKLRGWDAETQGLYTRHRWLVEGAHGRAKAQHGLKRAVRRGIENVAIQVYLTAVAMNLKKLARKHPTTLKTRLQRLLRRPSVPYTACCAMAAA